MSLRPALFRAGTPSPEVTGLFCRVPSRYFTRHTLGYSPWVPVSVLGTVIFCGFSWDQGLIRLSLTPSRVSHHDGSPHDYRTLRHSMTEVHELALAVTIIAERLTNINAIPFRSSRLRLTLGPANPRLKNIAEEPLPLRWCGFSPHYAATLSWILICTRSTRPYDLASTRAHRRATPSSFEGSAYRYSV